MPSGRAAVPRRSSLSVGVPDSAGHAGGRGFESRRSRRLHIALLKRSCAGTSCLPVRRFRPERRVSCSVHRLCGKCNHRQRPIDVQEPEKMLPAKSGNRERGGAAAPLPSHFATLRSTTGQTARKPLGGSSPLARTTPANQRRRRYSLAALTKRPGLGPPPIAYTRPLKATTPRPCLGVGRSGSICQRRVLRLRA